VAREILEQVSEGDGAWLRGGSAVIGPDGEYLTAPAFDRADMVIADLDRGCVEEARLTLDVDGHYSRPDVFTLMVERRPQNNAETE